MELEITDRLKRITKGGRMRYDVPVVAIKKNGKSFIAYLNKAAVKVCEGIGKANWYADDEKHQIYIMPSKAVNAYKPIYQGTKLHGYCMPAELVNNGTVKEGHYKIYRCKSGIGFRTYERLEDQDGQ